jgi:hypothetical protein
VPLGERDDEPELLRDHKVLDGAFNDCPSTACPFLNELAVMLPSSVATANVRCSGFNANFVTGLFVWQSVQTLPDLSRTATLDRVGQKRIEPDAEHWVKLDCTQNRLLTRQSPQTVAVIIICSKIT